MSFNQKKINTLIKKIEAIFEKMKQEEASKKTRLEQVHSEHKKSAANLVHYHTFRKTDLRQIQRRLGNLGMSRFANAQGHIMDSVLKTINILYHLNQDPPLESPKAKLSIKASKKIIKRRTADLLGSPSEGRRVRIMVTMPTKAATDYNFVCTMVKEGMNCARINCAHDSPEVWLQIIENIKKAEVANGREIKIAMDLAGPKIRTGAVLPGPRVRKFKPQKSDDGSVLHPAEILLVPELTSETPLNSLPLSAAWIQQLEAKDQLKFKDARGKKRTFDVIQKNEQGVLVHCHKSVYVSTGMEVKSKNLKSTTPIGLIPPVEKAVLLKQGEHLLITKEATPGSSALFDESGQLLKKAHISCQHPEIFKKIRPGDPILFDDGKIEGEVTSIAAGFFEVVVTRASEKGSKLKAEKGINFPKTNLGISGLTTKDKGDLEFIAKHADIVNFSFVNSKNDVKQLLTELSKWNALDQLGIILKIETKAAFDNLFDILMEAMRVKPLGVMIARGDLAVETGWDKIGKVQLELLELCGAAHIPVVWATQVLESMAKEGLPSRSEITDVTNSLKAECIMLNKGPYMTDVLQLLNTILSDMEDLLEKNKAMLPRLKKV